MENINIYKIIDEAMEKKDRSVSIFIHNNNVNISVYPYSNEELRWEEKPTYFTTAHFACPSCGQTQAYCTPYCGLCGEKLAPPIDDKNRKEVDKL